MSMATKTIVIAGGGFADTTLARCLAQPQGPHIDRVDVGHVLSQRHHAPAFHEAAISTRTLLLNRKRH